jgi:plastocyanin
MLAAAGLCAAALWAPAAVYAAPVKGIVMLPSGLKGGRRHMGYWHVENGNVPVQPAPSRGDTVVVLEGMKGTAPAAKTITVEIAGLQASTPVVVVGPGSVVELKNSDKVAHDLGIPESPAIMPVERLAPGLVRRARFNEPGGYLIRCAEYPHIVVSVIVVGTPLFAVADDKGNFKLGEVPDGKGTLKVWTHGRWVHDEPLEISGKPVDLQVHVTGTSSETKEQTPE